MGIGFAVLHHLAPLPTCFKLLLWFLNGGIQNWIQYCKWSLIRTEQSGTISSGQDSILLSMHPKIEFAFLAIISCCWFIQIPFTCSTTKFDLPHLILGPFMFPNQMQNYTFLHVNFILFISAYYSSLSRSMGSLAVCLQTLFACRQLR